jgi:hypothetical protein
MSKEIKKVSDVVNAFIGDIEPLTAKNANTFLRSWNDIIGERIAPHCKVVDVDKGMLLLEVDHPGWSQEIQFQKQKILRSLASKFPELGIKNLSIRVLTECKAPYIRQDVPVGAGVERLPENGEDCTVSENVPDELKSILEKLKESIKKGKQTS